MKAVVVVEGGGKRESTFVENLADAVYAGQVLLRWLTAAFNDDPNRCKSFVVSVHGDPCDHEVST